MIQSSVFNFLCTIWEGVVCAQVLTVIGKLITGASLDHRTCFLGLVVNYLLLLGLFPDHSGILLEDPLPP